MNRWLEFGPRCQKFILVETMLVCLETASVKSVRQAGESWQGRGSASTAVFRVVEKGSLQMACGQQRSQRQRTVTFKFLWDVPQIVLLKQIFQKVQVLQHHGCGCLCGTLLQRCVQCCSTVLG